MKCVFNNIIKRVIFPVILLLVPFHVCAKISENGNFVLVIDPGHGGKDYGAIGKITNEKTINLDVAKLFGDKVRAEYDNVDVVFTRENDTFVSLKDRADIANKASGDIFISIHVNSVDKKNPRRSVIQGASVYTLGLHKSNANLEVAKRENAVMALEDDYSVSYEGFNPESTESYIIFELSQNKHLQESISLANTIQKELVSTAGRADRGVQQAGYWVLWATGMPSVLVELDFICNPEMERFMNTSEGKEKMASSLFNAFSRYVDSIRGLSSSQTLERNEVTEITRVSESSETKNCTIYKVQFLTSKKELPADSPEFKGLKDVGYYVENGIYKYVTGSTESQSAVLKELKTVSAKFPGAFVVEFFNGKRVR